MTQVDNNQLLKKLAIANNLRHFEIQEVFALSGFECGSSRIKAWMAGRGNKNFEPLADDQLEQFLNGLIIYGRGAKDEADVLPRSIEHYVFGLVEAGNADLLDELGALIDDARDAVSGGRAE